MLLLFLGLCWAVRLMAIKLTADGGGKPLDILLTANIAIFLLLSLVSIIRFKPPPLRLQHLKFYGLAGITGFGAPFLIEITVASHLPLLIFVMLVTSVPLWTLFLSAIVSQDRVGFNDVLGAVLGFAAVAVVVWATQSDASPLPEQVSLSWVAAACAIPLLYSCYLLMVAKRWPDGLDNLQGGQGQATATLVIVFAIWLSLKGTANDLLGLAMSWPLWLAVISEILGLLTLFSIARRNGSNFVALANYISIVFGAILSGAVMGQDLNWLAWSGVALLVISLWLVTRTVTEAAIKSPL